MMSLSTLDESVYSASKELRGRGAPEPDVLMLMGTGVGMLPGPFQATWRSPLESISGVPHAWRGKTLISAEHGKATFWFLEDAPLEGELPGSGATTDKGAAWVSAFPTWLAACSGATLCVHTSAGSWLSDEGAPLDSGKLGLVSDHINLSGNTPLFGLGESRLGPLFPDQSQLHHAGLRRLAAEHGQRLGLPITEGVAACISGPAIETRAERAYYAKCGANFAVQQLAAPLISMSHAGLACLGIVALIGCDEGPTDVGGLVERSEKLAPALDELLGALAPELATVAYELREEV
jgi:purine-nucleoside phosphorylase